MTIDTICDQLRQALAAEAAKDGGPDVDNNTIVLRGFVEEDPVLKAVLLAKGSLTIVIKPIWPVTDNSAALRESMAQARQMAGVDAPTE